MEHLPHGELFQLVNRLGGKVPEVTCAEYMRAIAAAVGFMHSRGVMHRDIKPENILISGEGVLKLADFGTSCRLFVAADAQQQQVDSNSNNRSSSPITQRFTRCGTPEYLSPEMVAGTGHGCATDMWALGIMTYELLYGW